jgi:hypothetical protein
VSELPSMLGANRSYAESFAQGDLEIVPALVLVGGPRVTARAASGHPKPRASCLSAVSIESADATTSDRSGSSSCRWN